MWPPRSFRDYFETNSFDWLVGMYENIKFLYESFEIIRKRYVIATTVVVVDQRFGKEKRAENENFMQMVLKRLSGWTNKFRYSWHRKLTQLFRNLPRQRHIFLQSSRLSTSFSKVDSCRFWVGWKILLFLTEKKNFSTNNYVFSATVFCPSPYNHLNFFFQCVLNPQH